MSDEKITITNIETDREGDRRWKLMVVDILKRNNLAQPAELEVLADFARR